MRVERREGPTPAGGVYSEAIIDDAGRVVEVGEYDASGNSIARTYFEAPRFDRFNSETGLRPADSPREPVVTSDRLEGLAQKRGVKPSYNLSMRRPLYWWERLGRNARFNRVMSIGDWVTGIIFVVGWIAIAVWVIAQLVS